MTNKYMKPLLSHILRIGNILNAGDKKKGQGDGFEIESLSKAASTKGNDGVSVLKQIIIWQLAQDAEWYATFDDDHKQCYDCVRIDIKELSNDSAKFVASFNKHKQMMESLQAHESILDKPIVKTITAFFKENEPKIPALDANPKVCQQKLAKVSEWFMIKDKETQESTAKLFEFFTKFYDDIKKNMPKEDKKKKAPAGKSKTEMPAKSGGNAAQKANQSAMMAEMMAKRRK